MIHIQFYLHIFMAHSTEIREKAILKDVKISVKLQKHLVFPEAHYITGWVSSRKQVRLTVGLPRRGQGNIDRKELAAYIEQYPDAYLAEMAKHFHCSAVAVFYTLRSMGITRKKGHNVYGAGACKSGKLPATAATSW